MLALLVTTALSAAASAAPITEFSTGLPPGSHPSSLTAGPDGEVWFVDTGAIGRITPSGQITEFTAGLNPGSVPHAIVAGDDGNLWFTDSGTTKAIGKITSSGQIRAAQSGLRPGSAIFYRVLATNAYGTAAGAVQTFRTSPARPTAAATTRTTTTTLGGRRITLIIPSPSACTARSKSLKISLSSSEIPHSKAAKRRFVSASLFVDRGVKHFRHRTRRSHGRQVRFKVTSYTANRVVRRLPAQPSLRLAGLRSGRHTLTVRLLFKNGKSKPVRKTMGASFRVC